MSVIDLMTQITLFDISINNPRIFRGEWDSNPRVLTNMGLAIPRPTRLGDPRSRNIVFQDIINCLKIEKLLFVPFTIFKKMVVNIIISITFGSIWNPFRRYVII